MKGGVLFFLGIVIAVVAVIVFVLTGSRNENDYQSKVLNSRIERKLALGEEDRLLQSMEDTMFIEFFPVDPDYKVMARMEPLRKMSTRHILTSSGETQKFIQYAYLTFTLHGNPAKLLLLQDARNQNVFFLPFMDESNGTETYDGGRYLPVHYKNDEKIILDFNYAQNPHCAFNHNYSCPVPPPENVLSFKVLAGEKAFSKK